MSASDSDALSLAVFERHADAVERLESSGWLTPVRAALLFLDFSKGGDPAQRRAWREAGVDLSVHNIASHDIVAASPLLDRLDGLDLGGATELTLALIAAHGTIGQAVRGELTLLALGPLADRLRAAVTAIVDGGLAEETAHELVADALHVVNVCDTAAVRDNLWSDELAARFADTERALATLLRDKPTPATIWSMELKPFATPAAWLVDRLARLRKARIDAGEPHAATERAVAALSPDFLEAFIEAFRNTQIWYGEAATSALRPASQLKLIALGVGASGQRDELHHLNLGRFMRSLRTGDRGADYRVRLLDAVLESHSAAELFEGGLAEGPLVTLTTTIGGEAAASLDLALSLEAQALMTLLPIYETKSSAAFHRTLKEMCDLYDLRKDEFDRVANENIYLHHMNSARSDKERMLDWCVPGEIVEVGPGGGVVLDLLEERYESSRIIGLDVSSMVCDALRARKESEARRWDVIEGDAFELPQHVSPEGATTIVFCSVLHEIYSYLPYPRDDADAPKFQLESVREMIRSAWNALRPGGRIVIRDGVRPADGVRQIRFIDRDGPEFLELFADQFEGRKVAYQWVDETTARMSTADAMEFLYCYTWGPSSFPYEVREQYGIMTYDAYGAALLSWVDGLRGEAKLVELPPGEGSYLQPGYIDGLSSKVELMDGDGVTVALPDSNCLLVLEKEPR